MAGTSPIILTIDGPYTADGIQTDDGVEHFNDRIMSPFGVVGNLKSHLGWDSDTASPVLILDAVPEVVLVSRKPVEDWLEEKQVGVTVDYTPYGHKLFTVEGRNGIASYMLHDSTVEWWDQPGVDTKLHVGTKIESQWTPEGPPPERYVHVETRRKIRSVEV